MALSDSTSSNLPVALLAGGLATRLRPITEKIPKLLVEVAGEPFFSHQIRLLKAAGLTRIILCVGYLGEQISNYYGNGSNYGVEIQYSFDGPRLLGTAGALIQALPRLGDSFYVLYGDSYLPIDYRKIGSHFISSGKKGLMTVYKNEGLYDTSNVWFESGEIKRYDKKERLPEMKYIDYGLGLFRSSAFDGLSRTEPVDLSEVQKKLVSQHELCGYEMHERFYEIGSPEGLNELNLLLKKKL
jgi:NDP-sugar pyrophosphorylase family protein